MIKLVAVSRREGDRVFARVSPSVVREHPLAGVEDVFNAIVVGDAIGDAMFYGRSRQAADGKRGRG